MRIHAILTVTGFFARPHQCAFMRIKALSQEKGAIYERLTVVLHIRF
jgi:hypothetical protein